MAQAAVAPGLDSLAGMDAHADTLTKLENLSEEIDAALSRRKSNGFLRRAIRNWRRGDIARAGQLALEATQADGSNGQAYHVLAMALERMGHLHKALVTYERAFEIDPNDPDLLLNLGLTAWNLKMIEGAQRMFQLFIAARPDSPLGYNNLGTIQADQGRQTVAIETLRAALYRMPTEAILWNSLATVLAEDCSAQAVATWQDVVTSNVDAVVIAVTHDLLAEMTLSAVQAGKHVLVEKPLLGENPGDLDVKQSQDHAGDINDCDTAGGRDNPDADVVRPGVCV